MKTTIFAIIACLFIGTAYGLDVGPNPNPPSAAGWIDNGTNVSLQTVTDAVVVNSTLTVQGNAFSVGGSTLVVASGGVSVDSLTVTGNHISGGVDFSVGGGTLVVRDGRTTLSGPNGDLISGASVTASSFWGSGANLSGIPSTAAITAIDFWSHTGADLSPLTDGDSITGSTITATGNAFSVGGSTLVVKDGKIGIGTTAPFTTLDVNGGSTLRGPLTSVSSVTITYSASGGANMVDIINLGPLLKNQFSIKSEDSQQLIFGKNATIAQDGYHKTNGAHIINVVAGPLTFGTGNLSQMTIEGGGSVTAESTMTIKGNAFSVGGSTLSVSNGVVSVSSLTTNGRIQFALGGVLTKAQFSTVTPVVGDVYLCSNCTHPYDVCVGTGATLSGFRATVKSGVDGSAKGCGVDE